jgi:hypothetical protein
MTMSEEKLWGAEDWAVPEDGNVLWTANAYRVQIFMTYDESQPDEWRAARREKGYLVSQILGGLLQRRRAALGGWMGSEFPSDRRERLRREAEDHFCRRPTLGRHAAALLHGSGGADLQGTESEETASPRSRLGTMMRGGAN